MSNVVLRQYQTDLADRAEDAWQRGNRVVMGSIATGAGKSVIASEIAHRSRNDYGLIAAHRGQLVVQLASILAMRKIPHAVIGPKSLIKSVVDAQMEDFGRSYYDATALWHVGSVQTIASRSDSLAHLLPRVRHGIMDEGHHVLAGNTWGRVVQSCGNAKWWLPSATPERADGRGLGSSVHGGSGLVDELHLGPNMRWMIDNGYLTDYRVRAPIPSDLDLSDVSIGSGGEYVEAQAARAVKRSKKIVGDVVDTYLKFTPGMLGIVFAQDIEHGKVLTKAFNDRGVSCELITGDMPEEIRRPIMRRYKSKQTRVLVNVDLFGEGFDLPAVEVVMMVRLTASFAVYAQEWGRALRLLIDPKHMQRWDSYSSEQRKAIIAASTKPLAYIHDHVGNMLHFRGPPDVRDTWDLANRRGGSKGGDGVPLRVCINEMCLQPYERFYPACPYCGTEPLVPVAPKGPQEVDGDLVLYTPEMICAMFGVNTVEEALQRSELTQFCPIPPNVAPNIVHALRNAHAQKQREQAQLRQVMSATMPPSRGERENNRRFFHEFGVDTLSARFLNAKDARELSERILEKLGKQA